ncbi:MAG: ATP-binding cassette domain-containing protein [Deltaproteobacteria bacterium]|nr:MAG: ATP-binding cassette domain-containing protein [Deltaproteobacteria bacterium]
MTGDRQQPSTSDSTDRPAARDAGWARVRRLFALAWPYRLRLSLAIVCLLGASGLGLVYPRFFGRVIDAAFTERSLEALDRHTLALLGVFFVQAVFIFFRHYLMTWVGERVVADLRGRIYRHLLVMSPGFFHRRRTGELLSRLSDDVTRLQHTVGEDLSIALRNAITLVGGITILFVTNPKLTAVMLAVVPPLVIAAVMWGRVIRRISRQAQDQLARASAAVQEGIAGIETVQAFGREDYEASRYQHAVEETFRLFVRRAIARSWFGAVASFMAFGAIAGIFWLGGKMVVEGEITPGALTEFLLYTMLVAGAVGAMAGLWGNLQSTLGATARIFEILDEPPEIVSPPDAVVLGDDVRGDVRFEHVRFRYPERDEWVLDDLDLEIPAGRTVALVGASGAGKTTAARLVLRFYDPTEGVVYLDGIDLRRIDLASLRSKMAWVSQEPLLFSGTIRENIRYGRLTASDAEVEAAARAAFADGFIRAFPEGYDTVVGERGVLLSGGQRQRISIARAILRDPKVLVLDEATSALDAESEHWVQRALEGLSRGRTTLVIAHRLSTIRSADLIVVLDHGKVVETGRHEELLANGGLYARLVARQTEGVSLDGSGEGPAGSVRAPRAV